jgi:hypothetical protein
MEGQEEHETARKIGLFLIVLGMIVGFIGAVAAFVWGLVIFFYLGFFVTVTGFAIVVLSRIGESKK